ncbi:MAG: PLD nuclease N-terminal domain-containing protein [Actinomycetota bacterium]|nr:PLD nuclease N-terminal domain-containing protein [Actinomycetota bacterium]
MAKPRWDEVSAGKKAVMLAVAGVQIALAVAAFRDLARRPREEINGSKLKWAAIIPVNFIGPIAYFRKGRRPSGR